MHYIKNKYNIKTSQVTSKKNFINRRKVISGLMTSLLTLNNINVVLANSKNKMFSNIIERPLTTFKTLSKYNNFFEFGTSKEIWKQAQKLNINNWEIDVYGSNSLKNKIDIDEIYKRFVLEERIYKFRCVEAWSMVVPWEGFQLSKLIKHLEPKSDTRYVEFETFLRPDEANNQKQNWYPWPYKEIITIEEAMHPLSFLATGIYGQNLPKQNGAPIRLVLPWKYGFKSIKSISKITFSNKKSKSFWESIAPKEYGFWANVNPKISHPRWSQEYEKDIETGEKHPTKIFNGYSEFVTALYPNLEDRSIFY
tara:strand:- start:349 stop:1275 length:927 start_codon:yes stop_codon:yes gene_type:complete